MNEGFALAICAAYLMWYIILSSIEFGSSIFGIFPKLLSKNVDIDSYINPVWEVNNVFLICFVISLLGFFPDSIAFFGRDLIVPIFIFLIITCFRIAAVMIVFYAVSKPLWVRWLLFITSILSPVLLAQTVVYSLTGSIVSVGLNIGTGFFAVMATLALAVSFFAALDSHPTKKLRNVVGLLSVGYIASIVGLFAACQHGAPYLFFDPVKIGVVLGLVALPAVMVSIVWLTRARFMMFLALAIVTITTVASLFYLEFPNLIYGKATVYSAFTDPSVFPFFVTALIAGLVLVIPSFGFLYYLFFGKHLSGY